MAPELDATTLAGTGRLGHAGASEFVTEDGEPEPDAAARVQRAAVDEGLLLLLCGAYNKVVRMIPALVIDEQDVDDGLRAWAAAVARGVAAR